MARKDRLKRNNPAAYENEDVRTLAEQADQLGDIKAILDTEGGKHLRDLLLQDVTSKVHALEANYRSASHAELVALCADLSAYLQLARLLIKAEENEKALDSALQEALAE